MHANVRLLAARARRRVIVLVLAALTLAAAACGPFTDIVDCNRYDEPAEEQACSTCYPTISKDLAPDDFLAALDRCVQQHTGS
jgi:hypothetical protein